MSAEETRPPVRAQPLSVRSQIERILRITRRMIGWRIQGVETMVFVFDFRTISNHEADFPKTADDLLGDLCERVQFAERAAATGKGEISRLLGKGCFEFEITPPLGQHRLNFCLGGIDRLSCSGF